MRHLNHLGHIETCRVCKTPLLPLVIVCVFFAWGMSGRISSELTYDTPDRIQHDVCSYYYLYQTYNEMYLQAKASNTHKGSASSSFANRLYETSRMYWKEFEKQWMKNRKYLRAFGDEKGFIEWCKRDIKMVVSKNGYYRRPVAAKLDLDLSHFLECAKIVDKHNRPVHEGKRANNFDIVVLYSPYFKFWLKHIGGKRDPWFRCMSLSGKATWIDDGVRRPAINTPIDIDVYSGKTRIKSYHIKTDIHGKYHITFKMNPDGNGTKELFVPIQLALKGNRKPPLPKKQNGKVQVFSTYELRAHTGFSRYFKEWRKTILPPGSTKIRNVVLKGVAYWKDGNTLKAARGVAITFRTDKDGRVLQSKTVFTGGNGQFQVAMNVNPKGTKTLQRFLRIPLVLKGTERPKDLWRLDRNSPTVANLDDLPPGYRKKLVMNKKLLRLWIAVLSWKAIYDDVLNRASLGKGTPNLDALHKDLNENKPYRAALRMILELASSKVEEVAGTGGKVSDYNDKLQKIKELLGSKKNGTFGEKVGKEIRHYVDYQDYVINQ